MNNTHEQKKPGGEVSQKQSGGSPARYKVPPPPGKGQASPLGHVTTQTPSGDASLRVKESTTGKITSRRGGSRESLLCVPETTERPAEAEEQGKHTCPGNRVPTRTMLLQDAAGTPAGVHGKDRRKPLGCDKDGGRLGKFTGL